MHLNSHTPDFGGIAFRERATSFLCAACLVFVVFGAAEARALDIKLEKTNYRQGELVNAHLTANGLVTLENGIENKSTSHMIPGFQTIALGRIKKSGIYTARITQGDQSEGVAFVEHVPDSCDPLLELPPSVLA